MVASNTLDLPHYKGIGRRRGRGFGALSQVIGRTAISFLRKYVVSAAKRMGSIFFEFAVPEVANVVSGKKNFKSAAKSVGRQTLRKQLRGGSQQRRSIPTKNLIRTVDDTEIFLLVSENRNGGSIQLSLQTFCCSFWKSFWERPSC